VKNKKSLWQHQLSYATICSLCYHLHPPSSSPQELPSAPVIYKGLFLLHLFFLVNIFYLLIISTYFGLQSPFSGS